MIFNSICGQYYTLGSNNSLIQKSDTLYIFSETLSKMDLKTKRIVNSNCEIKFPDNFNLTDHTPFILKDKIVFLNKSSGLLYEYKNDSVIRIDNSYDNKTHNKSLDFIYNKQLHRFGGYGYFQDTNILIKYDDLESNQWDIVKYKGYEKVTPFSGVSIHFIDENKLYVLGYNSHLKEHQNELDYQNEGFIFDLEKREIIDVFKINSKLKRPDSYLDLNNKHVLMFYPEEREILIINKDDYSISEYKMSLQERHITNKRDKKFGINNSELFYVSSNVDKQSHIRSLNLESIVKNSVPLNIDIFSNNLRIEYFLIIIGFLIFGWIVLILIQNNNKTKNKVYFKGSYLYINKNKIIEDEKSLKIIRELINNPYLTNSQLNDFFYTEGLNQNHVNREKNKFINNLNTKIFLYLNKDLITREKNKYDKRMILFKINKKLLLP